MKKEELEQKLKAKECFLEISTHDDFIELLDTLKSIDEIEEVETNSLKLEFDETGYFIRTLDDRRLPMLSTSVSQLARRGGTDCELVTKKDKSGEYSIVSEVINLGLNYATDSTTLLYKRGGNVIGAFSRVYQPREQKDLYTNATNHLIKRFPKLKFLKATYSHDLTSAFFSIGDCTEDFMEAYALAWKRSGYDEEALSKTEPCIMISTSDSGKSSVSISAYIKQDGLYRILSDRLQERHYGSIAGNESLSKKIESVFAGMCKNIDRLVELMDTQIEHPVNALINAMNKGGNRSLSNLCKKACYSVINAYKSVYTSSESAYDVYTALLELQYTTELSNMNKNTVINTTEAIYRTLSYDWKALDTARIPVLH